MVTIVENDGGLKGLVLNGKTLIKPIFDRLVRYDGYFLAIGEPGMFTYEIRKDSEGNEVAIVARQLESNTYL